MRSSKPLPRGILSPEWNDMSTAPKKDPKGFDAYEGPLILGINHIGEQRVIQWTTEYPHNRGCWKYGWSYYDSLHDEEGIGCALTFDPIGWQHLPKGFIGE